MPHAFDRRTARRSVPLALLLLIAGTVAAAEPAANWGPYNVTALEGGIGLERRAERAWFPTMKHRALP